MAEKCRVQQYGKGRPAIQLPRDVENEIPIGTFGEAVVDREKQSVTYYFKEGIKKLNEFEE